MAYKGRKRHHSAAKERELYTIRLINDLLDKDQVLVLYMLKRSGKVNGKNSHL